MPKDMLAFWMEDNSGHHLQPYSGTQIPPHLRIDYLTFSSVTNFLAGDGLKPFARRFASNLTEQLLTDNKVGCDWSVLPDLFSFLQGHLFRAAVKGMFGKKFFAVNPTFTEDFWAFSKGLPTLAKGYPRWLYPKVYDARDKCIEAIKQWHAAIQADFDNPKNASKEWNEDCGASIVKFRYKAWSNMPRVGVDGAATEDFGMIWAYVGYISVIWYEFADMILVI